MTASLAANLAANLLLGSENLLEYSISLLVKHLDKNFDSFFFNSLLTLSISTRSTPTP